jgi:hypothetical protein
MIVLRKGRKCSICSCQLSRIEGASGSRRGDRSKEIRRNSSSRDSRRGARARSQSGNRSRGSKRKGLHLVNTI